MAVLASRPFRTAFAGNEIGKADDGNGGYVRVETPDYDPGVPYDYHMNVRAFDSSGGVYMNAHVYFTSKQSGSQYVAESSTIYDDGYNGGTTALPSRSASDLNGLADQMGWDIVDYMGTNYGLWGAGNTLMAYGILQSGCEDLWAP